MRNCLRNRPANHVATSARKGSRIAHLQTLFDVRFRHVWNSQLSRKKCETIFFLFFILKNTLWVLIFSKTLLPMEAKTVNQLRCAINICLFVPCLKILFTPSSSKKKNIPIFYRYAHATWSRWRWQFFVIVLSFYRTLTWTWRKWATEPAPTRGVRSVIRLHCSIRSSIIHAKQDCTKPSANFQTLYHLLLPNWQCRSVSIFRKK